MFLRTIFTRTFLQGRIVWNPTPPILERILNCCGLFEGKSPNPLPEGKGEDDDRMNKKRPNEDEGRYNVKYTTNSLYHATAYMVKLMETYPQYLGLHINFVKKSRTI